MFNYAVIQEQHFAGGRCYFHVHHNLYWRTAVLREQNTATPCSASRNNCCTITSSV